MNTTEIDPLKVAVRVLEGDELPTPALRLAYLCLASRVCLTGPALALEVATMASVAEATMRSYLNELVKRDLVMVRNSIAGRVYLIKL